MTKYKVGQTLKDNENNKFYEIIAVAPHLDCSNKQYYFVKVTDKLHGFYEQIEYFVAHEEEYLDENLILL